MQRQPHGAALSESQLGAAAHWQPPLAGAAGGGPPPQRVLVQPRSADASAERGAPLKRRRDAEPERSGGGLGGVAPWGHTHWSGGGGVAPWGNKQARGSQPGSQQGSQQQMAGAGLPPSALCSSAAAAHSALWPPPAPIAQAAALGRWVGGGAGWDLPSGTGAATAASTLLSAPASSSAPAAAAAAAAASAWAPASSGGHQRPHAYATLLGRRFAPCPLAPHGGGGGIGGGGGGGGRVWRKRDRRLGTRLSLRRRERSKGAVTPCRAISRPSRCPRTRAQAGPSRKADTRTAAPPPLGGRPPVSGCPPRRRGSGSPRCGSRERGGKGSAGPV